MTLLRFLWALALALSLAGPAQAQFAPVPPLTGHVTDQAGMLSADERNRLIDGWKRAVHASIQWARATHKTL